MLKVLIAEDEAAAAERISSFRIWDNREFGLSAVAKNGEEALKMIRKDPPDILITDIEMPVRNGLELIREIRKTQNDIQVIILSCHESFSYAREAVSLGVNDYIIKDFLEEEALGLALEKAAAGICRAEAEHPETSHPAEPEYEQYLLRAIRGTAAGEVCPEGIREFMAGAKTILFIHIDGFCLFSGEGPDLAEELRYRLRRGRGIAAGTGGGEYWAAVSGDPLAFASELRRRMKSCGITLTVASGRSFSGTEGIYAAAAEVRRLFGYRVFLGKDRIITEAGITAVSGTEPAVIRNRIEGIKKSVCSGNRTACFRLLCELYERDLPGMMQYNYLEYVNSSLISMILTFAEKGEINLREVAGKDYLPIGELKEKETVREIKDWFLAIYGRIFGADPDDAAAMVSNSNVLKVMNIIKNRYDEDLCLEDLAEEIGVHKVYLSRIFKKESGQNYYEYLQNYRIKKASVLLRDKSLKICEIALKTGFRNYDQFCAVFRKIKGMSPSDYRNQYVF